jgi:hypothetical protein
MNPLAFGSDGVSLIERCVCSIVWVGGFGRRRHGIIILQWLIESAPRQFKVTDFRPGKFNLGTAGKLFIIVRGGNFSKLASYREMHSKEREWDAANAS